MDIVHAKYTDGQWIPVPFELDDQGSVRIASQNEGKTRSARINFLNNSLNHPTVALIGSGASLCISENELRSAPSVSGLWNIVKEGTGDLFDLVTATVRYDPSKPDANIEGLLSTCNYWLAFNQNDEVRDFVFGAEDLIANACNFIDSASDLSSHEMFLVQLVRHCASSSRLEIFEVNYDLAFEMAASRSQLIAIDGFSHTFPQEYNTSYFDYDLYFPEKEGSTAPKRVPGVFRLFKLHGSIDWSRADGSRILRKYPPRHPVLIYPRDSKYQNSFEQPYLELLARFQMRLRSNVTLIVVGFGFNDFHIVQPIISALETNPDLRAIVVDPSLRESNNSAIQFLRSLVKAGDERILLLNGRFDEFVHILPEMRDLSPIEKLEQARTEARLLFEVGDTMLPFDNGNPDGTLP